MLLGKELPWEALRACRAWLSEEQREGLCACGHTGGKQGSDHRSIPGMWGRRAKVLSIGATGSEVCFFLNCELRCMHVRAVPLGREVWRRRLCCPVEWASLAAGDSPTGLGEEPAGLSAVDPVVRAWVLSLPACFQFCLHCL